jgi:hypothetical protein
MKARELQPGDVFKVYPSDPEGPVRVCLINDTAHGIRFTFPDRAGYWCSMGGQCEVELVSREGKDVRRHDYAQG